MKTSKTLRFAAVFCFALANMWIAVQPADAQNGGSGSSGKATVKKTYNSGQSTTGYTQVNPVAKGGKPVTTGGSPAHGLHQN